MIDSHLGTAVQNASVPSQEMQNTLQNEISFSGVGIFTGAEVSVRIVPAPVGTGIVFQRTDVLNSPWIPAHVQCVKESMRCTTLAKDGVSVMLVEHLLSALYACGIDNAKIFVHGPEIPGFDGSSRYFVERIDEAGVCSQEFLRNVLVVQEPIFFSQNEIHLVALPSSSFQISYTMHYPHSPLLKSQYYSFGLTTDIYRQEIAPCRTFSLYEEVLPLIEKGLIRGGGLDRAVVIDREKVLNPGGLRFPDEMVRHKVLDLIGDLSLVGARLLAHVIAIRSGHFTNAQFAKQLTEQCTLRSL